MITRISCKKKLDMRDECLRYLLQELQPSMSSMFRHVSRLAGTTTDYAIAASYSIYIGEEKAIAEHAGVPNGRCHYFH